MKTSADQLAVLNQLKDEGRISDEEYGDLEREILEFAGVPTDEPSEDGENDSSPTDSTPAPSEAALPEQSEPPRSPILRTDLAPVYLGILLVTSAVLILASSLGMLSWLVSIVAILALGATLVEGGRWVTIAGGIAIVGIVIIGLFGGGSQPSVAQSPIEAATQAPTPAVAGSLGISVSELPDLWNTVTGSPQIRGGFVHNTEPGQYDSFIYRFGDWGRLAGAYDPSTDAVYALLATGQLGNSATAQLYLHLCFTLHPYSQECIDSYFEQGLADGTLDDLVDVSHQAEWRIDDLTWRLDLEGNVLTIRVLGQDVS